MKQWEVGDWTFCTHFSINDFVCVDSEFSSDGVCYALTRNGICAIHYQYLKEIEDMEALTYTILQNKWAQRPTSVLLSDSDRKNPPP